MPQDILKSESPPVTDAASMGRNELKQAIRVRGFVLASAFSALYLAVLDTLGRGGDLTFHASKTAGDYVRDLEERRSASLEAFREFARRFERDVFGAELPNAATYRALAESAGFARTARAA